MMTFSVVIAAYEAARTVGGAIESVLAQTRGDFEVVVVDDGSRDQTATVVEAIAARDPRVKLHRQPNGGPSAARNRGIAESTGELLSMLDSDDLWLPNYLAEMGEALEADPEAGFAYTEAWELEEASGRFLKGTAMARQQPPAATLPHEQFVIELMKRNFVYNAVTVRRSVLERVGVYDASMTHGEDYELWLRIANSGFTAVRVPGPLAIKRDSVISLSTDDRAMAAGVHKVYEAVLERHPASPAVKAFARERLAGLQELELDRSQGHGRLLAGVRGVLAAATRRARIRLSQRATPPPGVAEAFPGLGRGNRGAGRRAH